VGVLRKGTFMAPFGESLCHQKSKRANSKELAASKGWYRKWIDNWPNMRHTLCVGFVPQDVLGVFRRNTISTAQP